MRQLHPRDFLKGEPMMTRDSHPKDFVDSDTILQYCLKNQVDPDHLIMRQPLMSAAVAATGLSMTEVVGAVMCLNMRCRQGELVYA